MTPSTLIAIYWIILSIISCTVTITDKYRAKSGKWRIRESTLFVLAILGGSAVMLLTMLLIRHKTKHVKFMLGIPVIMVLQAALALFLVWKVL
jgi:uncharacterized membrane protein YsdA (DUF1294 family)